MSGVRGDAQYLLRKCSVFRSPQLDRFQLALAPGWNRFPCIHSRLPGGGDLLAALPIAWSIAWSLPIFSRKQLSAVPLRAC
jgi:hypothetical protein